MKDKEQFEKMLQTLDLLNLCIPTMTKRQIDRITPLAQRVGNRLVKERIRRQIQKVTA